MGFCYSLWCRCCSIAGRLDNRALVSPCDRRSFVSFIWNPPLWCCRVFVVRFHASETILLKITTKWNSFWNKSAIPGHVISFDLILEMVKQEIKRATKNVRSKTGKPMPGNSTKAKVRYGHGLCGLWAGARDGKGFANVTNSPCPTRRTATFNKKEVEENEVSISIWAAPNGHLAYLEAQWREAKHGWSTNK